MHFLAGGLKYSSAMRWYRSCIQSRTEAGCGIKRRRTIVSSLIHKTVLFICKESGGEREVDGRRIPGIWSLWYWKNIFWCVISDIWLSIMLNWNVWQGFCIACGEYCKWRVNTWLGCDFGDNFLHRWGEVLELILKSHSYQQHWFIVSRMSDF